MSYTEIYKVKTNGDVELYSEVQNSYRGASLVWKQMAMRYIPVCRMDEMAYYEMWRKGLRPVWDLARNERVPLAHRIVMTSTFDNVMVRKEDIPQLINAMRQFAKDFDDPGNIPAEADILEKMFSEEDTFGACWNQTSVNCGPWTVYDPDEDVSRPYNVFEGSKHWFMFQEIEQG